MDVLGKPASLGAGGWGQEIILIILNDFLFDSVSVIIIFYRTVELKIYAKVGF